MWRVDPLFARLAMLGAAGAMLYVCTRSTRGLLDLCRYGGLESLAQCCFSCFSRWHSNPKSKRLFGVFRLGLISRRSRGERDARALTSMSERVGSGSA